MAHQYNRQFVMLKQDRLGYGYRGKEPSGRVIVETDGDTTKISVFIQDLRPEVAYRVFLVNAGSMKSVGVPLGTLCPDKLGRAELKKTVTTNDVLNSGLRINDFNVFAVIATANSELIVPLAGFRKEAIQWKKNFAPVTSDSPLNTPEKASKQTPVKEASESKTPKTEMPEQPEQPEEDIGTPFEMPVEEAPSEETPFEEAPEEAPFEEAPEEEMPAPYEELPEGKAPYKQIPFEEALSELYSIIKSAEQKPQSGEASEENPSEQAPSEAPKENPAEEKPSEDYPFEDMPDTGQPDTEFPNSGEQELEEEHPLPKQQPPSEKIEPLLKELSKEEFDELNLHEAFKSIAKSYQQKMNALETNAQGEQGRKLETQDASETILDLGKEIKSLFENGTQLRPFAKQNKNVYWIRLRFRELALLNIELWKYIKSPFVLSCAKKNHHLLLGRHVDANGKELFFLGVPDCYSSAHKPVANSLGFTQFKCCDNVPITEGEYGYWLMQVTFK